MVYELALAPVIASKSTLKNLLVTATMLSSDPGEELMSWRTSGPNQSPLSNLQALNIWGAGKRFADIHADAIRRILSLEGSFEVLVDLGQHAPVTL